MNKFKRMNFIILKIRQKYSSLQIFKEDYGTVSNSVFKTILIAFIHKNIN